MGSSLSEQRHTGKRDNRALFLSIGGMLLFSFSAAPAIVFHSRLTSIYLREVPPTLSELSQLGSFAFYADVLTTIGAFLAVAGFLTMARLKPGRIALSLSLLAIAFVASFTYGLPLTFHGQTGPTVVIRNFLFSGGFVPSELTVVLGVNSTVTWMNDRDSIHPDNIVSDTGAFNSGLIRPGGSWSYTFTSAGIYPYHSVIHFWMKGTIRVLTP